MKNEPTPRALFPLAALPNLANHLKLNFLPALLLAGMASLANAAVITPQLGGSIDPVGGSEWDYDATNSVPLSAFNTVSNLTIQANWNGVGAGGNIIDGADVDVQIAHSPGFSASASSTASYNSSSVGNGYLWTGTNGQQLTISFGTYNGSFTADRAVQAAGLMLMNFGAAYTDVTIRYYDATNGLLSTQNFAGGGDLQDGSGGDFFTGYTNSQEVIAKFTIDITRTTGASSSIALDALAYAVTPPPTNTAATRIYTSTTDGTWTSGANWSGGTIFAGSATNVVLGDEGLADDIASFTNTTLAVGINMSTLAADDGVGLVLGAIDITGGDTNFQLGMGSGSTTNGIVQLNGGAWLGGSSNTMIRLSSGFTPSSLTISNINAGGYTMGLRLGSTNGVFNVASGKTLRLDEAIDEVGAGSGFSVTGGGTLILSGNNSALAGGQVQVNGGGLRLLSPGAANTLGGADGPDVVMTSGTLALGNSFSLPNDILIPAGAGTVNIQSSAAISANYSGNVTALDDVQFFQTQSGGNVTVSGTNNSIATNQVVSFRCNGSGGDLTDNAIWSGEGRIVYATTSGGGGDTAISGQKTHSGGSTIDATFTNAQCLINTSSTGPAGAPTSGPFGTGTLTLGGTARAYLRAGTNSDITIGNPVTILSGGVQFTTTADEKSLIFTGAATMVGGNRQLTVLTGTTDPAKYVEFSGGIGDDGSNRNLTKANAGKLLLSGTNTYTGNTIVNGGTLTLVDNGQLKFVIGGNGTNNQVNGNSTGTATLDGDFYLDVAGADTTLGNTWTLVDKATVSTTFGATFSVKSTAGDFTGGTNVWSKSIGGGKAFSFSEATGVLTVVSAGPSGPATLTNSVSGTTLSLSWPAEGWRLQQQTNALSKGLSTNWVDVTPGSATSTNITIDKTKGTVFYRLVYP